jgi:hypothetical protein
MTKGKGSGGGKHGKDVYVQTHPDGWQVNSPRLHRCADRPAKRDGVPCIGA